MSVTQARSRVANAVKDSRAKGLPPSSAPKVLDAKRDLAAAKLSAYITKVVAEAPPLSPQQRARLAALLTEGCRGK